MNDDTIDSPYTDLVRMVARKVDWLKLKLAADPDGQLAETSAMLRLKRGCRR